MFLISLSISVFVGMLHLNILWILVASTEKWCLIKLYEIRNWTTCDEFTQNHYDEINSEMMIISMRIDSRNFVWNHQGTTHSREPASLRTTLQIWVKKTTAASRVVELAQETWEQTQYKVTQNISEELGDEDAVIETAHCKRKTSLKCENEPRTVLIPDDPRWGKIRKNTNTVMMKMTYGHSSCKTQANASVKESWS